MYRTDTSYGPRNAVAHQAHNSVTGVGVDVPRENLPMLTDSLIKQIDNAVAQAVFVDVYKNRLPAPQVRHLYEHKQGYPLSSTDAITVPSPDLEALTKQLGPLLGTYRSPISGLVGNGLYALTGSLASPRLPSCQDYAKILVLAASRIGAERVVELLDGWIQGGAVRVFACVLLKGLRTEGQMGPVTGMHLDTLSNNGDHLPRSLRLHPHEHWHEQFTGRAMLSLECETLPGLYDPEVVRGNPPLPSGPAKPLNPELFTVSFDSLCRAISLETNNQVDWFIHWNDYGDVEAFFLNPGFSSQRKDVSNSSTVSVSEEQVRRSLDTLTLLQRRRELDLPIARWRKSKSAPTTNERLIELRIALESILLSDDTGTSEKRHRLATRGAWLLGETFEQRETCFNTLRHVYDYASSVIHGGTPRARGDRDVERDIATVQDLCRDAILHLAAAARMPNSDDWSALTLGGKGLKDKN